MPGIEQLELASVAAAERHHEKRTHEERHSIAERFERWKATPGGGQVLCRLYRISASYYGRWKRTGRGVSQRLLWESLRDRIEGIKRELRRRNIELQYERGFLLNDHFTAHAVRHMIAEHPDWAVMFELRQLKESQKPATN